MQLDTLPVSPNLPALGESLRPRVDFFVPGFSKCGTTTLCSLLAEHPGIFVPEVKETAYFAYCYEKGWDWYSRFFAPAREHQLCGEGSTFYSTAEQAEVASARIVEAYPDARFIFVARDPIKRLESSFRECHHGGHLFGVDTPYDIGAAMKLFPNMVADTLYWQILSTYRTRIPDHQILTVFLEDMERQPTVELDRCFRFLGVDPAARIEKLNRRLNTGETKYYDSRLMRRIRRHTWLRERWEKVSDPMKTRATKWLGLRKRFTKPIHWTPAARAWLLDQIGADARQFLQFHGKPAGFWEGLR